MRCAVCRRSKGDTGLLCRLCRRSYDRDLAQNDGSMRATIEWAAKRARRFLPSRTRVSVAALAKLRIGGE